MKRKYTVPDGSSVQQGLLMQKEGQIAEQGGVSEPILMITEKTIKKLRGQVDFLKTKLEKLKNEYRLAFRSCEAILDEEQEEGEDEDCLFFEVGELPESGIKPETSMNCISFLTKEPKIEPDTENTGVLQASYPTLKIASASEIYGSNGVLKGENWLSQNPVVKKEAVFTAADCTVCLLVYLDTSSI